MSAVLPRPSPRAFALIVLVFSACVLGLAPILVRLTETGPAAAGFWRFLFALPLLTLLAAREPRGLAARPSKWALIAGLIPPAKRGGRRREVDLREVMNGVLYVLETGCQWRALPKDLPRIDIIHDLSEEQKQCGCGTRKSCIGQEVSEKLDYLPARLQVERHIRLKYACKS